MSAYRPHRFAPLAQLGAARPLSNGAQLQASLAAGFQEGLAKGYEQGLASGLQSGQEQARQAAEQAGRAQGQAQGRQEMLLALESPAAAIDALLARLHQLQQDYQVALRREVVELVERVARQVIRAELTLRPSQLAALVDETLSAMPPARHGVELRLNPDDLQRLRELAPERVRGWTLQPDAALEPGECHVLAGGREADAGCGQRLAACMAQVRQQLGDDAEAGAEPAVGPLAGEAP